MENNNDLNGEDLNEEVFEEGASKIEEYFDDEYTSKEKVTDKLKLLYLLTEIDKKLADIEEEKGDLPDRIDLITESIKKYEERISENKNTLEIINSEIRKIKRESKSYEEKANKLDEEKYNVRNNKEYDMKVRQIDEYLEILEKNEKTLKEKDNLRETLEEETSGLEKSLEDFNTERNKCIEELNALNEEFREEEIEHTAKREEILKDIDAEIKSLYERINSSYKGEAIAIVRKGNCSGCYNSIPPQRAIEIRMAIEIYTCQSCGRILIDESLVD